MSTTSKSKSSSSRSSPPDSKSTASALKRLLNEIKEYENAPNEALLHLGPVSDEDLFQWEAVLKGVKGSAYEGGLWLLTLTIPPTYPHTPPTIHFVTPICHPNINFSTGEICLTLLTQEHWSPLYTLSSTLTAIQQLLTDPTPDSPLNVDIAKLLRDRDQIGAESLVRFWTGERRWGGEGKGGWISEKVVLGEEGR
ncbi:putative ubiquitin conjugating enzyme [Phaeomoniella chlamydospora]|uniref:Putative ubiquitin conjugating enzyme n=1 Tax=Phaeomoniella chlamydospora TaxID=158046 RepID=A0A0G2DTE3_PHACM|nr:putative ubiquitin conjugating enzyme [Phaeomoniella chlamydospora]